MAIRWVIVGRISGMWKGRENGLLFEIRLDLLFGDQVEATLPGRVLARPQRKVFSSGMESRSVIGGSQ